MPKTVPPAIRPVANTLADVFQRETREAIKKIAADPILDYSVKTATIQVAGTKVAHGLGRIPVGWFVVDRMGNGDIYRSSWDSQFVTFIATNPVTVAIRFF
jgi:hypothetical protein